MLNLAGIDLRYYDKATDTWIAPLANGEELDALQVLITQLEQNVETAEQAVADAVNNVNEAVTTVENMEQTVTNLSQEVTSILEDFVQKVTVDDLPMSGIVSAHRGGGATGYPYAPVAADGGFSGYDMAIRLGAHIIDVDYRTTSDGVMIAMHDTTVDRTTNGEGLVSDHLSSALPNIETSRYCGSGWADEPIPTIEEILIRYGGRVIITIEAKEGVPSVVPLANLIKKYKLSNSVFINTHLPAVATEIVAQGCIAHVWGCDSVQKVNDAATVGAWLIEVPHDASIDIVNAALNSSIKRVIAGPVWFKSQVDDMTHGIMGHVTDAIGMTNRKTGDAPLVKSIVPSLKANKVGVGWRTRGIWKVENQKIVNYGRVDLTTSEYQCVYFGDLSGAREGTYTILFKVVLPQTMIGKASGIRLRICCLIADGNGWDADTDGYVCNIRGNGQMNLWKSNGSFGSGILLGQTTTDQPVSAGVEYTVMINVTPTTITMTREDTGQKIEAVDSAYRGGHIYLWSAGVDAEVVGSAVTDISITA